MTGQKHSGFQHQRASDALAPEENMSMMKEFIAACGLLLAFSAFAAQPATAQATTIVVIDEARIFTESLAGKDIQAKLSNIETQINNELEPSRRALQTDEESIQSRVQGKTPEQVSADEALMTQLQGFERKRNEFAQRRALVSQQFALTERKALADFNAALEPVVMEVVRERNAQLVLQKSQVVYSVDAIDVTALVISKLDARTPTINVVRQQLPAQQQ